MWTEEQKQLSLEACKAWQGTAHRNRIAVLGEGIDCVHFVAEVLTAAGLITRPRLPRYDERLGILRAHNVIEDILLEHLQAERHEPADIPQWGDIVVCTVGTQTNHVGIIIAGDFWHCPGRGAVGPEQWKEWRPRTQALVRVTGTGYRKEPDLTWAEIRDRIPQKPLHL